MTTITASLYSPPRAIEGRLRWAILLLRLALAAAFLSAAVDRFGVWGDIGKLGVSWGTMQNFHVHVGKLNPWLPSALIAPLSWLVTTLEVVLGALLISGHVLRWTSLATAVLLLLFGLAQSAFQTVKLALNFSVFTAAAAAYLLHSLHSEDAAHH